MRRQLPIGVVLAAAVVLAVGAAGAIWATGQSSGTVGDTARFVPADVALYATVNTDPASRQWIQTRDLLARLGIEDDAQSTRDQGLLFADLGWDEDFAPFLGGEATVALFDLEGVTPRMLAVLSTQDGGRAWDHAVTLLDERAEEAGSRPGTRTHRGSEIRSYHDADLGSTFWIARKDRYLLLGTDEADAERTLDLAAGDGESLAGLERFRAARSAVTDDSLVFLYINPAAAGDAAAGLSGMFGPGMSSGPLQAAGWEDAAVAIAASAERTGLRFEWQVVGLDTSRNPVSLRRAPDDSRFAERVPADTLLFVSGADLYGSFIKGTLESLDRATRDWGAAAEAQEMIDALNREIGIDLEADLLAQLSGEYAVAAGARSADLDSAWLLAMTAVKDSAGVGRALAKLEEYARRQGEPVRTTRSGSATITQIGRGGTGDSVAYTLAGNDLIAGLDVSSVQGALSGSGGLSQDAEYREALRALPPGRSLTVFVNISRALQRIPELVDELGWEQAMNLRSLAAGFTQDGDRVGGVAFLRVGGE